jgi:short-subunit dehydrogenase
MKGSGVSVICLAPGTTESEFFGRTNLMDAKTGQEWTDDPRLGERVRTARCRRTSEAMTQEELERWIDHLNPSP